MCAEHDPTAGRHAQFERERQQREAKLQVLCCQGFQSCILCHPLAAPRALVKEVMPLLAPSASFAVFHPALQPLAECMDDLIVGSPLMMILKFSPCLAVCFAINVM